MPVESGWEPSIARPGNPLQHFKGDLVAMEPEDREADEGSRTFRVIKFSFTNLEVIKAREPYPFDVTQIDIGYADPSRSRGGTRWAAFSASCRQVLGEGANISGLLSKRQEWAQLPAMLRTRADDGSWGDQEQECWKVVAVEGATPGTPELGPMEVVYSILEGKTDKEFADAAMQDANIRRDGNIVGKIVGRTLLPELEAGGKASKDDSGIWHVVPSAPA